MGVFGTIWDVGEAAGDRLGLPATFDVLAGVTALVTVGLIALVRDPGGARVDSPIRGFSLRSAATRAGYPSLWRSSPAHVP
jgi:hypothetical protein